MQWHATPTGTRIVRPGGAIEEAGPEVLNGFSVVKAASFEAALAMAQACPYLEKGRYRSPR